MRLLPDSVREYVQLHGSYGSFAEVRSAVDQYDQKLRDLVPRQEDRGREAVSRVEATGGALRAGIVAIEVIVAVAKIVDEGSLRVQGQDAFSDPDG